MMPHEMQQSIASAIDHLDHVSCHPDVLSLCLEWLRESEVELPAHIAWILESLVLDLECYIPESLYQLRQVESALAQSDELLSSSTPNYFSNGDDVRSRALAPKRSDQPG